MEVLEQEIVKMLAKGAMHAGQIRNQLDVSQDDVLRALRRLESQLIVECLWRINKQPIQTSNDAAPDRSQH